MENAELVMQLLEEFSKIKPKDIPRELEEYLGYVAKTGDPVYQWTLIRHLFREKLITVITDFYESTLTVELPPCPNVDPFNYERMKSSLLERFDSFSSAPFTVQRICELLTNPRKEYNRADKYMRAIEKNILVVSTREPGSGKRPLECDSQCETVLNGIPEMRGIPEPGSLIHVPTELPYLGAPPASNDVTVETTELNLPINDGLDDELKTDVISVDEKSWLSQNSNSTVSLNEEEQEIEPNTHQEITSDVSVNAEDRSEEVKCSEDSRLSSILENKLPSENTNPESSMENLQGNSDVFIQSCVTTLPDSLNSSDSLEECKDDEQSSKIENEDMQSVGDENEVSSTPENIESRPSPTIEDEKEDPSDSEAEATNPKTVQDTESNISLDNEINSSDTSETSDSKSITICEITDVKSDEVDLVCDEITGTVDTHASPEISNASQHIDDQNVNLNIEELEQSDNPDSSNDVCFKDKLPVTEHKELESCIEADSVSESNSELSQAGLVDEAIENVAQCEPSNEVNLQNIKNDSEVTIGLPKLDNLVTEECTQSSVENSEVVANSGNEEQFLNEQSPNSEILIEVQSSSEVAQEMCDQEQREDSVIQTISHILPDSQHQIEEISVDPNCDIVEEAMDVDDCSNQMMVSEGENEGEPMDQSDQQQS